MEEPEILVTLSDGIARVTLNRPECLNAMNGPMMDGLEAALEALAKDPAARCVVLTGAGRSFSAGGDVREMRERAAATSETDAIGTLLDQQIDLLARRGRSSFWLMTMPKPTIAVMRGHAVGGALALALACDLRIAARGATLTLGFANLGLSGDFGMTYLLQSLVGSAKARELCLMNRRLGGEEAERIGLVTSAVDDEALEAEADALARSLAAGPTLGFGKIKENLYRANGTDFESFLRHEALNTRITAMTRDCREAGEARAGKRPPIFEGR